MGWGRRRKGTGKRMTQKEKIAKDIARCERIAGMAGKTLDDFMDNRNPTKGLGDYLPIEIKLAARRIIDAKLNHGKRISSDEAALALTKTEKEILDEINATRIESSYDKKSNVITMTVWKLPPTINSWNSFYTSEKQHVQAVWDGIMHRAIDPLKVTLPYDIPILVEGQAYKSRLTDEDNAASSKNPMDAMKHRWLVWDDSPTYVKYYLNLKQIKCKKEEERIVFKIYPYPDDVEFYWGFRPLPPEAVKKSRMIKAKKNKK